MRLNKSARVAAAVSAALMAAGCGGGDGPTSISSQENTAQEASELSSVESSMSLRLEKAERVGITKVVHVLSDKSGAYGRVLAQDGWVLVPSQLETVVNDPRSIVLINADSNNHDIDVLNRQFGSFRGVLIIDSDMTSHQSSAPTLQGRASESTDSDADSEAEQKSRAADFYGQIAGSKARAIPLGTAIVTSATTAKMMAIHVGPDGSVNGAPPAHRERLINPVLYALANWEQLNESRVGRVSRLSTNPPGPWDREIDFASNDTGWDLYGQIKVEAYMVAADFRHFVEVRVETGDNSANCYVAGHRCGVYPTGRHHIAINTDSRPLPEQPHLMVVGPAYAYDAFAVVNPAIDVRKFQPSATNWTSTEARETDSYETVWSEGFSIGGSFTPSFTTFNLAGISGAYTNAKVYRKITHRLLATDSRTPVDDPGDRMSAWTGIHLKDFEIWGGIRTPLQLAHPSYGIDTEAQKLWREYILNGYHCIDDGFNKFGYTRSVSERLLKPKMSFEGWNTAITANFEVPKERLHSSNAPNNFVTVVAGVRLKRPAWRFQRVNHVSCHFPHSTDGFPTQFPGYKLVHPGSGQLANPAEYYGEDYVNHWHYSEAKALVRVYQSSFLNN